jgi:predicted nucleic acid-binding protein
VIRTYFADSWFFVALLDRRDSHHAAAVRLEALTRGSRVVTHDSVLSEVLAHFSGDGRQARLHAVSAVRRAALSHLVVPADRSLFIDALALYEARPDKEYSLVDCMSMTLMKQRGLTHVLTNDHHFAQEGFVVLNDAP